MNELIIKGDVDSGGSFDSPKRVLWFCRPSHFLLKIVIKLVSMFPKIMAVFWFYVHVHVHVRAFYVHYILLSITAPFLSILFG